MGWKDTQLAYAGDFAAMKTDALISRRILDGMGFKAKHLKHAEIALFGEEYESNTLICRVLRVFTQLLKLAGHPFGRSSDIFVREIADEREDERFAMLRDMTEMPNSLPLIFARMRNTRIALAFAIVPSDKLAALSPPYKVKDVYKVGALDGRLIVQELSLFVRSLIDYGQYIGPVK